MRELNYGIHSGAQIGGKHLQAFVRHRLESGIAGRTVANEMSHLRAVLKHVVSRCFFVRMRVYRSSR
jgi:hypothetical protein